MRTQVGIIGAGPAGLVLAHLLHRAGIESVILETRSRAYVEHRLRAGVLEQPTVDLLRAIGVGARLDRDGLPHHGLSIPFDRADHRIALTELTGSAITVYGQQEIVKDLIEAALAAGQPIEFEVADVALHDLTEPAPWITFRDAAGGHRELRCAVVAGCDGFHGISRQVVPPGVLHGYGHEYPFAWLGILAETAPSHDELIYTYSPRGFALHSMRSPKITRLYLQVDPDERAEDWSDDRIWAELHARLDADGFVLHEGPVLEKSITAMRSFTVEPMRYGNLFLAGDAAHIVPPTGAKGMNLAIADVRVLAAALSAYFRQGRSDLLDEYSERCLRRVWRAQHFSWWMTSMLHLSPGGDAFDARIQLSQLRYTVTSPAAATSLAENYVGLPFEELS